MSANSLTDADVLLALRGCGSNAMTYVIANVLGRKWSTSAVRRRLQSMERRGLVKREPTSYVTQLCWSITAPPSPAKGRE